MSKRIEKKNTRKFQNKEKENKENGAVLESVPERKEKLPGEISESGSKKRKSLQNSINRPAQESTGGRPESYGCGYRCPYFGRQVRV